jgi:predicted O-methyltransferase YrrM
MYSATELAVKYLNYAMRASNGKGHGIHSPFVYEFVSEVLNDSRCFYPYAAIEKIRSELEKDQRVIPVEDLGGGSSGKEAPEKKIADITRRALSTQKFGRLLFRVVNHYQPKHIIELGTSLGISGAYMGAAYPACSLISLEGSSSIAAIASETFKKLNLENTRLITGDFQDTLERVIQQAPPSELVFIDGNHRKEPVLNYFQQFLKKKSPSSIFIFHDIHWSREMEVAWQIIQNHPEVMLSVDLFSAGFVFFQDTFRVKQQFTIRF